MTTLAPREAYRLWAADYEAENAVTRLEDHLVARLGPSPAGLSLLDVGCGTGRRLVATGAARALGVDLSPEMLARGRANPALTGIELLEGDICALPLPDAVFELVWCRLAIGHVAELDRAFAELARVTRAGGTVVVTDFHADAHAAGHRRTFRHRGEILEVEHHARFAETLIAAAERAGLRLLDRADAVIGPDVRDFYERAGRAALYREHRGLPLVLALVFWR